MSFFSKSMILQKAEQKALETVCLGIAKNQSVDSTINFIIIWMKYYIFLSKCKNNLDF